MVADTRKPRASVWFPISIRRRSPTGSCGPAARPLRDRDRTPPPRSPTRSIAASSTSGSFRASSTRRAETRGRELAIVPVSASPPLAARIPVLLYTRRPPNEVESVAVDSSSRTSVALLASSSAGASVPPGPIHCSCPRLPTFHRARALSGRPPHRRPGPVRVPAEHPTRPFRSRSWTSPKSGRAMMNLPFVFAFWAGPRREDSRAGRRARRLTRRGALEDPESRRERAGADPELEAAVRAYLSSRIHYGLDHEAIRGLEAFYGLLADERLAGGTAPASSSSTLRSWPSAAGAGIRRSRWPRTIE